MLALPDKIKYVRPAKIEDCFEGSPSLATVSKYQSREVCEQTLAALIFGAAELLNVGKDMSPMQVGFMAEYIAADYPYFTLADVKMCLRMGVLGKFGEVFGRLDVQVLAKWFAKYAELRLETAEQLAYQRHKNEISRAAEVVENPPKWFSEWSAKFQVLHGVSERPKPAFVADAAILATIQAEYEALETKPDFENFKRLRVEQMRAAAKR